MSQNLNMEGRSEWTSQDYAAQRLNPAGSAEEAYDRREKLHLGSDFHIAGDLRNWVQGWSHDIMLGEPPTDFTRVLCLNVGGGFGFFFFGKQFH